MSRDTMMIIIVGVIAVFTGVMLLVLVKSKKTNQSPIVVVDEKFINDLINTLGTITNIINTSIVNARLKIEVKNIKDVNTDELSNLATKGVFITGNNVKVSFDLESKIIKDAVDSLLNKNT